MLMWRVACAGVHQSLFQLQSQYEKLMHVIFSDWRNFPKSYSINFILARYHQLIADFRNQENLEYSSMRNVTGRREISALSCLIARLLSVKAITCRVRPLGLGCRPQSAVSLTPLTGKNTVPIEKAASNLSNLLHKRS